MENPTLRLCLLGQFELTGPDGLKGRFGSRLDEQLLAAIALAAPGPVPRAQIASMLWPHMDASNARKQVAYYLFHLRRRLKANGASEIVEDERDGLRLSQRVSLDTHVFIDLCDQAQRCQDASQQALLFEAAIAMYGSGLLPQISAAWVIPHQERFARLYGAVVRALAEPGKRSELLRAVVPEIHSTSSHEVRVAGADAVARRGSEGKDEVEALVSFTQQAGSGLSTGERGLWVERLRLKLPQIQDALSAAIAGGRLAEAAALLVPIWRYWQITGSPAAGADHLGPLLRAGYLPVGEPGARFMHALGTLEAYAGRLADAERHLTEATRLWHELERPREGLLSRANLGIAYFLHGDFTRSREVYAECISLARSLGDQALQVRLYLDAVRAAIRCRDVSGARRDLARRQKLLENISPTPPLDTAQNLVYGASISLLEGAYAQAREEAAQAGQIFAELGNSEGLALASQVVGRAAYWEGDLPEARRSMAEAVVQARLTGSTWLIGLSLGYLATVVQALGASEEAAEILGDAELLLKTIPDAGALTRARAEIEELKRQGAHKAPPD